MSKESKALSIQAFGVGELMIVSQVSDIEIFLNFKKIEAGCADLWFGSTSLKHGTSPKDIIINESEPFHFVQLLFVLKEMSWQDDKWMLFTKNGLLSILKQDEKIYLENDAMFGQSFVDTLPDEAPTW